MTRDPSRGIVKTGMLSLNEGPHQYRMRVENNVFIIDHLDHRDNAFKNDFIVYPQEDPKAPEPEIPLPTLVPAGELITPLNSNLKLSPSGGTVIVNGALDLKDNVITLNAVPNPTDQNASGGGLILKGTGSDADPQKISMLWNENGGSPYWTFSGGGLALSRYVGSGPSRRQIRYMFKIDDATEQLQLWKCIDEDRPKLVNLYNAVDNMA